MKYTCGVEYQNNGKKPNLPDGVLVIALSKLTGYWLPCFPVGKVNWRHIYKFKIVDERYKPKEQDMDDWYEKGELPPANTECEVRIDGQWLPTVVIGHYAMEAVVVDPCVTVQRFFCTTANNLRPIRTEKDKLIDAVEKIIDGCDSVTDRGIAHAIINAGYRKIKPMTEEKFVALVCISFDVDEEFCRELYQGGCRFIEKGECNE